MKAKLPDNNEIRYLTPEDTFGFTCRQCGKCCLHRDDVLLTGPDIYRVSQYLGIQPNEFIHNYCEIYIGENSRIPICRLKPQGKDERCPLLKDNLCIVHEAKPTVCALYLLARAWENGQAKYFLNSGVVRNHGIRERHKVADWLRYGNLPVNDEAGRIWNEILVFCVQFMHENEKKLNLRQREDLRAFMAFMLYNPYSHAVPLEVMMQTNYDCIRDALPRYLQYIKENNE